MDTTQIVHYAQMLDLELSHFFWALIAVVAFFIRNELSKIHKFMEKSEVKTQSHDTRITKLEAWKETKE